MGVLESTTNFQRRYNISGIRDTGGYVIGSVNAPSCFRMPTTGASWSVTSGSAPNTTGMTYNSLGYPINAGYGKPGACFNMAPSGSVNTTYNLDTAAANANNFTKFYVVRTPTRRVTITNYADNALAAAQLIGILNLGYRGGAQDHKDYVGVQVSADGQTVLRCGQCLTGTVSGQADTVTVNSGFRLGAGRELFAIRCGSNQTAIQALRNNQLFGANIAQSPSTVDQLMFDYMSADDSGSARFPMILDDFGIVKRACSDAEVLAVLQDLATTWGGTKATCQVDVIGDSITNGTRTLGGVTTWGLLAERYSNIHFHIAAANGGDARHYAQSAIFNQLVPAAQEGGHLITSRKCIIWLGHNAQLNAENPTTWGNDVKTTAQNWVARTGRSMSDVFFVHCLPIGWCSVPATRAADVTAFRAALVTAVAALGIPSDHIFTPPDEIGYSDGTAFTLGLVATGQGYQTPAGPAGVTLTGAVGLALDGTNNPGLPSNVPIGTDLIHMGPNGHRALAFGIATGWSSFMSAVGLSSGGGGQTIQPIGNIKMSQPGAYSGGLHGTARTFQGGRS